MEWSSRIENMERPAMAIFGDDAAKKYSISVDSDYNPIESKAGCDK